MAALLNLASCRLTRISKRRVHFNRKTRYAGAFVDKGLINIGQQLYDCEETEILACCSKCQGSWYVVNHCRLRVCPLCSYRVTKEREKYVKAMCAAMAFPKMITLTMPTYTGKPQDGIKLIRKYFNQLRRSVVMNSVKGGCYQVELVQKSPGWHIHIHALVDSKYIPRQLLFSRWCKITGLDYVNVHIEAATTELQKNYVCKYPVKTADFNSSPTLIVEWYIATKGARLFSTFGKWYNATIEQLENIEANEDWKPKCPHCNEEGTTFMARDGPFIYGPDLWRDVRGIIVGKQEVIKDIREVKDYLHEQEQSQLQLDA